MSLRIFEYALYYNIDITNHYNYSTRLIKLFKILRVLGWGLGVCGLHDLHHCVCTTDCFQGPQLCLGVIPVVLYLGIRADIPEHNMGGLYIVEGMKNLPTPSFVCQNGSLVRISHREVILCVVAIIGQQGFKI